jgi:phenylalanyl-tRNA synthetase alpha chain
MSTAHLSYQSPDDLHRALRLRDLSDPAQGAHAMQLLLDSVLTALTARWGVTVNIVRVPALVSVRDNYDRLGYRAEDITRDARYTRYASPTTMLRSHTSANIPHALSSYTSRQGPVDELIVIPGLVYRRDVVDRTHVGEPHQVDLWRLRSQPSSGTKSDLEDLEDMVAALVEAVVPSTRWRTTPATHPYTRHGRQVDVWHDQQWLELAECGLIHPDVLTASGLDPRSWSGLALGMGLERALMLRKAIPDIRYLRSTEPRIAGQMGNLDPWRQVSLLPPITRDMSVVINADTDDETLGDQIRTALGDRVNEVESIVALNRTNYCQLPARARQRLGLRPDQVNALIRLTLRPLEHTLTDQEANQIRNTVYRAIHRGTRLELA